jgi:hypothetical protein
LNWTARPSSATRAPTSVSSTPSGPRSTSDAKGGPLVSPKIRGRPCPASHLPRNWRHSA